VDVAPERTLVWRRYIDAEGAERPLPAHALVTSRGHSARAAKRTHYALMCRSAQPLSIRHGDPFDPEAFRNASGTGAPVGASQVTALLRRVAQNSSNPSYEENITAWLIGSYWVRLSDPIELDAQRLALQTLAATGSLEQWCDAVVQIRSGPRADDGAEIGVLL
jgi:hypothetical protein